MKSNKFHTYVFNIIHSYRERQIPSPILLTFELTRMDKIVFVDSFKQSFKRLLHSLDLNNCLKPVLYYFYYAVQNQAVTIYLFI